MAVLLAATGCGTAEAVRASAGPAATTMTTKPPRSGVAALRHRRPAHPDPFHQSTHDGARQLPALPGAVLPTTLEDRERDTGAHGAADVGSTPTPRSGPR